jgi:Family of unknown function (DUF6152)
VNDNSWKLLLAIAALAVAPVFAHHGDAGRYEDTVVVMDGTVVSLQLTDPHSVIVYDVTGGDGKTVRWQAELTGRSALGRQGWTRNTLKAGDKIKLTGRKVKSGAPYLNLTDRANVVMTESGKEVFRTDNYGTDVRKNPVVVN